MRTFQTCCLPWPGETFQSSKEIHVDFEKATLNALKSEFKNASLVGCYFHFRNCLKRKAVEFKLTTIKHKYIVNLCSVLALLPVHAINDGWQYIKSKEISTDDTKITKFIKYFE